MNRVYSVGLTGQPQRSHVIDDRNPNQTVCGRWISAHWEAGGEDRQLCDHCDRRLSQREKPPKMTQHGRMQAALAVLQEIRDAGPWDNHDDGYLSGEWWLCHWCGGNKNDPDRYHAPDCLWLRVEALTEGT
jgi:hypothetical protein